jgi:hypothetical protein
MITETTEIIKNIITAVAIMIAGIWTIYRFGINREKYPKLQFDLDLQVLGKEAEYILIELTAILENKGLTRLYIKDFTFNLLFLKENAPIDLSDEKINSQLKFNYAIQKKAWVKDEHNPFIDGGIIQRYRYVYAIPHTAKYAMIYSKFRDTKKSSEEKYYLQRAFNLSQFIPS